MTSQCPTESVCWRCCYTKCLDATNYSVPPSRFELFLSGFAPAAIMPKGGIFAETIPQPGVLKSHCPALRGIDYQDCHEHKKWLRRVDAARRKRNRYPDKRPRTNIPQSVRRQIAADCHYSCSYCGVNCSGHYADGVKVQTAIEHIVPLSLGGLDVLENLTLSCKRCNDEKGEEIWPLGYKMKENGR